MKKRPTDPKTKVAQLKEAVLGKKVFYAVTDKNQDVVDKDELYVYPTIEEAYREHINDYGTEEPCYAYKIEFVGEVSMQLTIKP